MTDADDRLDRIRKLASYLIAKRVLAEVSATQIAKRKASGTDTELNTIIDALINAGCK